MHISSMLVTEHAVIALNFKSVGYSLSWNKNTNLIRYMQQLSLLKNQSEKLVDIQQAGSVPAVGVFNY